MNFNVHVVSKFGDGELAMGIIQGVPGQDKIWIINAGRSKFVVRSEDNGPQLTDADRIFDSPEDALKGIELLIKTIQSGQGQINGLLDLGLANMRRNDEATATIEKATEDACRESGIELYSDEYDRVFEALILQNLPN